MKKRISLLCTALAMCLLIVADSAQAQFTQVWKVDSTTWPIQGFNTNNMRGAALNRANGHYLVARKDLVRIYVFNGATGALLDSLNMTGVAGGGGSALQDIEVTNDGVVYATNLVGTPISASDTTFKIYRWADDNNATVPTVAYSGRPLDKNGRFGDAFDVAGTGTGTVIYVGGNNAGTDSVLVFTTADGSTFTNSSVIKITGNDAGMGIAQISAGGDFLTSRYTTGSPIRLYSGTGAGRLDAVPATVTPAFQADITYLEAAGRKWVASVESLATLGHGHKAVLLNTTYGLSGAVKVGTTPVIGINANTSSIGGDVELQYNAADSTMTVYLMVDNNGIAAYKSGNLLTINLPPFGGNIVRSQFVPMAGQNDTVFVDVQDDQFIPGDSTKLNYNINEGSYTVVSMTRISGDSVKGKYQGIIPGSANTNSARITYYVTVADNQGVRFTSATSKYFAGLIKMTLAGPRAVDSSGVNLWVGYGVRVQGICIQEDSLIAVPTSRHDVVLQDASGAMDFIEFAVNSVAPPWRMKRGRVYTVAGLIGQYNGKIQVAIPATGKSLEVSDNGPGVLPVPTLITIRDLAFDKQGEQLENALIKISNVRLTGASLPWPAAGAAGTNITITDNGIDSMTLRVPALSSANGFPPLRQRFSVVGVAGQYDASSPYKDGYQLMLRQADDLTADVKTGFKDTTVAPLNTEVIMPVSVENVNGLGINGFKFDAQFDSTALQFISASNLNSISSGYTFSSNLLNAGTARVVGSGAAALVDSGVLYTLRFKVLKMGSFTVALSGSYNEGNPTAALQSGIIVGSSPTENEPNDSLSVANSLTLGVEINGNLSSATGDPDFYWFNTQTRGHLMVDVTDAANTTDADIYLFDSTGKMLYNVDRNNNDRLEYNLPNVGKYFIKVAGYNNAGTYSTGLYKLLARIGTATDANEPNDGPLFGFMNVVTPLTFDMIDTTNTLDPGVGIPGNDYDYFRIVASPGQTITAVIQSKTFKSTSTLNNVQGKIYRKATFPTALVTQSTTTGADVTLSQVVAVADTYYVRIVNSVGSEAGPNARYKLTIAKPTGVIEHLDGLPLVFALDQNYPNPFNPSTVIRFALPQTASTRIVVYDMLGREVRSLINNEFNAGYYEITWDGKNNSGSSVATGVYIYRIEAGTFISNKKMMLLK